MPTHACVSWSLDVHSSQAHIADWPRFCLLDSSSTDLKGVSVRLSGRTWALCNSPSTKEDYNVWMSTPCNCNLETLQEMLMAVAAWTMLLSSINLILTLMPG